MQVTSIFDKTKPIPMPMFQSGFIMAIVKPLYVAMSELDGIDVSPCLSCLESNLGHWQTEKEKLLAAAAEKKKAEAEEEEKKKKEEEEKEEATAAGGGEKGGEGDGPHVQVEEDKTA